MAGRAAVTVWGLADWRRERSREGMVGGRREERGEWAGEGGWRVGMGEWAGGREDEGRGWEDRMR